MFQRYIFFARAGISPMQALGKQLSQLIRECFADATENRLKRDSGPQGVIGIISIDPRFKQNDPLAINC